MDINDLRGLATLFLLLAFIGLIVWVYLPKRREAYKEAGRLPLDDELRRNPKTPPTKGDNQ